MNRRAALAAAASLAVAPRALAAEPRAGGRDLLAPAVFTQAFWAVCEHTLRSGTLRDGDASVFERLLARTDEQARALERRMKALGEIVPVRPRRREEVRLPGFAGAKTRGDYLSYAAAAASGSVSAWYAALQQLDDPDLLRLAAAGMAADAQSVLALRRMRGREPLPAAFEVGRPE